jgi:peptidyl-prolyl cis-trans isomerase SurA
LIVLHIGLKLCFGAAVLLTAGSASFSELARQHSVCPSKRQGGELGWVSPNQLPPGFEPVVAAAAAGEVSRATTARGHHLVMVLEEK